MDKKCKRCRLKVLVLLNNGLCKRCDEVLYGKKNVIMTFDEPKFKSSD